jgi:hypothetical protein
MNNPTGRKGLRLASLILLLALFTVMAAMAISRETPVGSITGRVTSFDKGKPVEGARIYHPSRDTYVKTDARGQYVLYGVPEGTHTINVMAKGFSDSFNSRVKVGEGKTTGDVNFSMMRRASSYEVYAYQKVFSPGDNPAISFRGYLVKQIQVKVFRVNPLSHLNYLSGTYDWGRLDTSAMKPDSEMMFTATFNEDGEFQENLSLPLKEKGLYIVKARAVNGKLERSTWVLRTDLALITKRSPGQVLVYAQSLTTGKPVKGAAVRLYEVGDHDAAWVGTGQTDGDGLMEKPSFTRKSLRLAASSGSDFAFSRTYYSSAPGAFRTYLYTERPVYRPGQTIFFKGIVRERVDHAYLTREGIPVKVKVTDTRGAKLLEKTFHTNSFGTINGSLKLGDEPALGQYYLSGEAMDEYSSASFQVSEYKKPEYKVDVSTDKPQYVAGDRIRIKVKGTYYFGAPVKGAPYNITVYESTYRWSRLLWADYESPGEGHGNVMFETSGTLDEGGEAEIVIPTKARSIEYSKYLGIDAEVTDVSGRQVTGSAGAPLSVGEFAIYSYTPKYLYAPGEEMDLRIEAMDYQEKPVKGQKVDVKILSVKYNEVKETKTRLGADGRQHSYDEYRLKRVETQAGSLRQEITDDQGKARLSFTPQEAGSYEFEITSRDARGNGINYTTYAYVSTGESGGAFADSDLTIITDKKSYKQGDRVKALVSCSRPGTYVLVTVEGRKIHRKKVIHVKSGSETFEFPLVREYFPNVFLQADAIKDMDLISATREIRLSRDEKRLQVSIKPDKERYYPGDKARYTVTAKDHAGRPVRAEVSLGVVDQAIYAIAKENTPDIHEYFWSYDNNYVDTTISFARDYSGGADKFPEDQIRKKFEDTACWAPTAVTDGNGRAVIEFQMPDNLTTWVGTVRVASRDTQVGSSANWVICTKDLLVRLETPRFMVQRDKIQIGGIVHNYTKKDQKVKVWLEARGVDMAGDGPFEAVLKPGEAKDYYWLVDAKSPGQAGFTLFCRGSDASDAMELPVPVLPFGVEELDSQCGSLSGDVDSAEMQLKLPDGVAKEASRLQVLLAPSLAATMLENLDYLIHYPYGCVEQTMSAMLPAVAVKRAILKAGIRDVKMEKEIPAVVERSLKRLYGMQHYEGGWGWWNDDASNPHMTAYVLMGMKEALDNGFPVSRDVMTRGLSVLKKNVRARIQPAAAMGGSYQEGEEWNTRAYVLYALYKAGSPDREKTLEAYGKLKSMNEYALALMAMTLDGLGEKEKAGAVMDMLDRQAVVDRGQQELCHWDGRTFTYSWMDNQVETTAYCLMAYVQVRPGDPRILKAISWLTRQRRGNYYTSTKDTAAVIFALTAYLEQTGEHTPDYRLTAGLNGKKLIDNHSVQSAALPPQVGDITIGHNGLQPGDNLLTLQRDGRGSLYYSAWLRYFIQPEKITPVEKGLKVKREYNIISHRKNRNGQTQEHLTPLSGQPVKRGEKLRVIVTIEPDADYRFVIVEDPLPAGFELDEREEDKNVSSYWAHREVRDEKVAMFVQGLSKKKPVSFSYDLHPEMYGTVSVLPALAYCMYDPQVRGHSGSEVITIEKK